MADLTRCKADDCNGRSVTRGLCDKHYSRWKRHGDPSIVRQPMPTTCSIEQCNRRHYARGRCYGHYQREPKPGCEVDGCEVPQRARGLCPRHYVRQLKHGDPHTIGKSGPRTGLQGANHQYWTGDAVQYRGLHHRIRKVRGSARNYTCPCGAPASEWAYDHRDPNEKTHIVPGWHSEPHPVPFSTDVDHYIAMCHGCHTRLDRHPAATVETGPVQLRLAFPESG